MGFTKFAYKKITSENNPEVDETISYVEIQTGMFTVEDLIKGKEYNQDSIIYLHYFDYEEPKTPEPVFYSTNDYDTAKNGNTGVYSYKNTDGNYDVYWIIDFDEGYVYNFTDGNGDNTCDKVKIVSGNLNDSVTVTWHDGGEEWSWYLHFKYVDQPVTLIVNDHNGFDIKFTTTDLSHALKLKNEKRIVEY